MIEVYKALILIIANLQTFKERRFYLLSIVIWNAHMILVLLDPEPKLSNVFYINNYIDWD
jgi:hypothetical protein